MTQKDDKSWESWNTEKKVSILQDIASKRKLENDELNELFGMIKALMATLADNAKIIQSLMPKPEVMEPSVLFTEVDDFDPLYPPIKPRQATIGSAGYDLFMRKDLEKIMAPDEVFIVDTGIKVRIPEGYAGIISSRSGLGAKQGVVVRQGIGLIDSDYRGEIKVVLHNVSDKNVHITPNYAIAQIFFMPVLNNSTYYTKAKLDNTNRGAGGFGSTDKRVTPDARPSYGNTENTDVPVTC